MLFNIGRKICHSKSSMNLAVSILLTVILLMSPLLWTLHSTFLPSNISFFKPGFRCDFFLKISIISSCRFFSLVVINVFFVRSCSKVDTPSFDSTKFSNWKKREAGSNDWLRVGFRPKWEGWNLHDGFRQIFNLLHYSCNFCTVFKFLVVNQPFKIISRE